MWRVRPNEPDVAPEPVPIRLKLAVMFKYWICLSTRNTDWKWMGKKYFQFGPRKLHTDWGIWLEKGLLSHALSWLSIAEVSSVTPQFECSSRCFSYIPVNSILWLLLFWLIEVIPSPAALFIYLCFYFILGMWEICGLEVMPGTSRNSKNNHWMRNWHSSLSRASGVEVNSCNLPSRVQ